MADRDRGNSKDSPPHSRLFIIHPKHLTADDFRKHFEPFGTIEDLYVVRERGGDPKGVTYIKYSKTSEAANAMEKMNKQTLGGDRPLKVMVAAERDRGSKKDLNEEETIRRLFVIVPRTIVESELKEKFEKFGEVESAIVLKDRVTKEPKGCAFIKFRKFSDAAKAYEECDRSYKALFAQPKSESTAHYGDSHSSSFGASHSSAYGSSRSMPRSSSNGGIPSLLSSSKLVPPTDFTDEGYNKLIITGSPLLNQDQMWRLFNVVPTMEYCSLTYEGDGRHPTRCVAEVMYNDAAWASYARDKLHGFEYPPGTRLIVRPIPSYSHEKKANKRTATVAALEKVKPDLMQIAETIKQATSLIQAAGLSPGIILSEKNQKDELMYSCTVKLPPVEPLVTGECVARCFIVCNPYALSQNVLRDIFCRYGNLIDVYMVNNKNYGFAKFTSKVSAELCIQNLHEAEINAVKLKVIEAEETPEQKRRKTEEQKMHIDESSFSDH
ncbi:unnamed protein product [Acanthoscelides obtectus]|uniref:RRM domain-containing protein n=2 Tax=Acanthoscelides obtectus TaxID=200917 RepID=A0A9P0PJ97_ACAOB|nr:unnamed protein product [Acanthoscelides obtectus]CAK1661133.1 RNA-binding protein 45 [Acanthoscelides obtectus]